MFKRIELIPFSMILDLLLEKCNARKVDNASF